MFFFVVSSLQLSQLVSHPSLMQNTHPQQHSLQGSRYVCMYRCMVNWIHSLLHFGNCIGYLPAIFIIESIMEHLAASLKMKPYELKAANMYKKGDSSYIVSCGHYSFFSFNFSCSFFVNSISPVCSLTIYHVCSLFDATV